MACSTSGDSPQRSSVPGRKFSISTSAVGDQALHHLGPGGVAEVERDRALVAGEHRPPQRHAVLAGAVGADRVALGGVLDLDHVRAEVGEHGGGQRAGEEGGGVEDRDAGQGARAVGRCGRGRRARLRERQSATWLPLPARTGLVAPRGTRSILAVFHRMECGFRNYTTPGGRERSRPGIGTPLQHVEQWPQPRGGGSRGEWGRERIGRLWGRARRSPRWSAPPTCSCCSPSPASAPSGSPRSPSGSRLSKAAVHRILASLRTRALVEVDETTRRYSLGPAAFALGVAYQAHIDVRGTAAPELRALSAATQETATLSVFSGHGRIYVDQVTPAREIVMSVPLGLAFPLHAGASSKALLAFLPDAEIDAILKGPAGGRRRRRPGDALRQELAEIRRRGYRHDLRRAAGGCRVGGGPGVRPQRSSGRRAQRVRAGRALRPHMVDGPAACCPRPPPGSRPGSATAAPASSAGPASPSPGRRRGSRCRRPPTPRG